MTKRFLASFSTVSLMHLGILLGGSILINYHQSEHVHEQGPLSVRVSHKSEPAQRPRKIIPKSSPQVATRSPEWEDLQEEQPRPRPEELLESQGSSSSTLSERAQADLRTLYQSELRSRIESNKHYPIMSRRMGQTGLVVVAFTLLEDGSIINIRIDTPSRFDRLDASALDAVKKVGRFKPIPKELGEKQMDLKVPVNFKEL